MSSFDEIIQLVRSIPRGRVASYGQIAAAAGKPRGARLTAWALHALEGQDLARTPWWRVVNRKGVISTTCEEHTSLLQKQLLEKEGVEVQKVDGAWQIDLHTFGWIQQKKSA
jgi:methylated-DNA-protein-cysteine methyltransferase-like protein